MTSDRLRQVEDLFHAARERPPEDREAFVAAATADDIALRREVESLLRQTDGTLLRGGVPAAAAALTASGAPGNLEGRRVGQYVLGPLLGTGGMGDVYRARDEALGRQVAVKILPDSLDQHPDRLARFDREARALAALNHPNIATIHGVEVSPPAGAGQEGLRALVMELVEGDDLARRLSGGPLPVDEALALARQIADGLAAAHRKGIIHRDLKPANIRITSRGVAKILDFGVAKIEAAAGEDSSALPVLETRDGVVLGTVAYMSPEQARGLAVDKRTDIWAFGCVLFEMLSGTRPFPGDRAADVFAAITSSAPEWSRLPAETPRRVRDVLRRCLTKDPDRRLHDIADARIEIEEALAGEPDPDSAEATGAVGRRRAGGAWAMLPWLVAGSFAVAAAIGIWSASAGRSVPSSPARVSIPVPPDVSIYAIGRGSSVAISPDGQTIVFAAVENGRTELYLRRLDRAESTPIAGTEGGANPFFSPDGLWVGFTTRAPAGAIKKVPVQGGAALTVVEGGAIQSATWGTDDAIVYALANPAMAGLWKVPSGGGPPSRLTTPGDGAVFHSWPRVIAGGRAILYTVWNITGFDGARLVVQPLDGGMARTVVERASYGHVVTAGDGRHYLLFARPEGLLAAPFDLDRLEMAGTAMPVIDDVLVNLSGGANYAVSPQGTLAYVPGGLNELDKTLVWVGRDGAASEIATISGFSFSYRLSPDGRRVVRPSPRGPDRDIWVDDLERPGTPLRLTSGGIHNEPIWTADGTRVVYSSGAPAANLYWRAADGTGDQERLTQSPNPQAASSVSPDGAWLAYFEGAPTRGADIWLLPLHGTRTPKRLLQTPASEINPMISPDGRWVAYQSNLSGRFEIYVMPIAGGGRQHPVSIGGGHRPLWSRDGRELYYRSVETTQGGDMMVAAIDTSGAEPSIGPPRVLFPSPYQGMGDVGPDGRFLLLRRTPQEAKARAIELVLNWFEDLRIKVPR